MKAIRAILLLLALGLSVYGQAVSVTANKIKGSATAPSGACSAQQVQLTTAGVVYVCASGTWTSSGGGTTINSTNGQVPYRVNSTTFGDSAFASNALNSTYLSATSGASGAGLALTVVGGGTNEALNLSGKGTGGVNVGAGTAANPALRLGDSSTGLFAAASNFISVSILGAEKFRIGTGSVTYSFSNFYIGDSQHLGFGTTAAVGLTVGSSSGIARLTNISTGAGQFLIGTSTDTADAQLSVYSQSTTRPGLKLRALSGTAATQNVFESYNAAGTLAANLTSDGRLFLGNGAAGAGNYALGFTTNAGIYSGSSNQLQVYAGQYSAFYSGGFSTQGGIHFTSGSPGAGTEDLKLERDAANTLAQKNGNADQLFRSYGANSGYWERGSISESITLSTSGTTTDSTADLLPANAIIEAVTARITTTITTATDWALGDATTAARFAAANSTLTAGTTSVGLQHVDQTGAAGPKQTSAAKLRITTTGTPGAGVIRVTVYYRKFVPPTS